MLISDEAHSFLCYKPVMKNNKASALDLQAISQHQQRMLHAVLPKDHVYYVIASRLLERLDYIRITPAVIVVVGWYTESLSAQLQERYPTACIQSVAFASLLASIAADSVDLVISNFAMAIEPEPFYFLHECYRILRTEGLLLFTTLGPDTLHELRNAFSKVDAYPHVHTFIDMHHVGDWLRDLRFAEPVVDREEVCLLYDELGMMIQDCRAVGIRNMLAMRRRSLMTKPQWNTMLSQYALLKQDCNFPVTLEIIYGHSWKVTPTEETMQEVTVSVDAISRKR